VLRTNLSTRPFYNERAIHALAAAAAVILLAVTAWQIVRVVGLSRKKTELNAAIERYRQETAQRTNEAAQIRRGIDQKELAIVSAAAQEANDLIEQRTFSWTELFNHLQATLPNDVMLTSIAPDFKEGITLNVDMQGKTPEDIEAFWGRLEKTGAFHDIVWSNVLVTEQGFRRVQMRAAYTPTAAAPETPPAQPEEAPADPAAPSAAAPAAPVQPPAASGRGGRGGGGPR
jgi:Tfp pilus assembly protein PilN